MLRTPENQGYGGNQKLGYRYAIDNGFDIVALVHGDGQYAPEKLPELIAPLVAEEADAVFGSRMIDKTAAREGGMPAYKWIGNQILTAFQNRMLGTGLSEFHSGYRLYSTAALAQIPFEKNTNDFHFDTEIIVQLVLKKLRIAEIPIPTYYGDEICHVNGMKYAWNVCKTMLRARFHEMNLLFDRKFDVLPPEENYDLKLGYASSHTAAIDAARSGNRLLDIGCGQGYVARQLAAKGCKVTGMDQHIPEPSPETAGVDFIRWNLDRKEFPVNISAFDQIMMLDIIEHLKQPEQFMDELRFAAALQAAGNHYHNCEHRVLRDALNVVFRPVQLRPKRHSGCDAHPALYLPLPKSASGTIRLQRPRSPRDSGALSQGDWVQCDLTALSADQPGFDPVQQRIVFVSDLCPGGGKPTVHNLLGETIESSDRLRDSLSEDRLLETAT